MHHLLLALALLTTALTAQDWSRTHRRADLEAFLASRHANERVSVSKAYRTARARGWLRDARSRRLLKTQLKAIAGDRGAGRFLDFRTRPAPLQGQIAAAAKEAEYNDTEGFADDLGTILTPVTVTGALSVADDTDSFRFRIVVESVLTIDASYTGSEPALMLTNEHGDETWGYHFYDPGKIVVPLPAGIYHLRIGGSSGGTTYSLKLSATIKSLTTIAHNQTRSLSIGLNPAATKIVLTKDSRVQLSLSTTTGTPETYLCLQNAKWGYIYDVDDASNNNSHAGLDAQLPKGTYYVYYWADTTLTTSVKAVITASNTPTLAANASATGTLAGSQESFDLFKITTTKTEKLGLTITGNGAPATTDSYLILYDRNMTQILECDDRAADSLSAMSVLLPAGTYYATSNAYWEGGGYKITRAASSGTATTAYAGVNPGSLGTDEVRALAFSLGTPSRVEFDVTQGTGVDVQVGVIDAKTGLSFAWEDDENLGPQDCNLGMQLPAGDFLVYVRDYAGSSGSFDARILAPLYRTTGDVVNALGKGGSPLFFVISTKASGPTNPLPGIVSGNLLLDLAAAVIVPLGMPASGKINFGASLKKNSGLFVQFVEVDRATGKGAYSNLLK